MLLWEDSLLGMNSLLFFKLFVVLKIFQTDLVVMLRLKSFLLLAKSVQLIIAC